jgi:glutaminase
VARVSPDRFGLAMVLADGAIRQRGVVPATANIAVWSPGLSAKGAARLGALALERLAGAKGWSFFEACRS